MKSWEQFLDDLDDLLYKDGWYVQGARIKKRGYRTKDEVIEYLVDHCGDFEYARQIVKNAELY